MNKYTYFSCISLLIAGCSSSGPIERSLTDLPDDLAGNWFICEFSNASDCSIFDDDGIALTSEGRILRIEETSQVSLAICNGSPCFSRAVASVQATQAFIGTYTYSNGNLSISIGGCDETSALLLSNNEAFIQIETCDSEFDDSESADGSLLRKYAGSLEFSNSAI